MGRFALLEILQSSNWECRYVWNFAIQVAERGRAEIDAFLWWMYLLKLDSFGVAPLSRMTFCASWRGSRQASSHMVGDAV